MRGNLRGQAIDNVTGQHDGFLNFKKLLGFNGGQWIFLSFNRAVLQGQIHFSKSNRCRVGAACFRCGAVCGYVWHANLDALHASAIGKCFLSGGVARTVVGVGGHLNACLGAEFTHHFGKHWALRVSNEVVAIAEDEGVVSNAKTRISARCKRGAADDHVDRTQS